MTVLIITRGVAGSGKTTRARAWVAEDPTRRARVNRDDLRRMCHNGTFIRDPEGPSTEAAVTAVRGAAIAALLRQGVGVVCDDTNLPQRVARDLRRIADLAGAELQVWDLTDVPVDECVRRDAAREGPARVGEEVVRRQHARYVAGKPYPLPFPDDPASDDPGLVPYVPRPGDPAAVLVDIDGTAALMCGRSPYDETRVHEDRPNPAVITAVRAMHAAGHAVVFCSGRTEACRGATEKWLAEHVGVPHAGLHMRPAGDMRKDAVVKAELFDRHIRHSWRVTAVFDDRDQVVAMWRAIGLTVFQVADGNF